MALEQRSAFGMDRIGLFEFSRSPLREDWSLLRLWGSLPTDLRQDALGDGCSVTAFPPDAQAEFQSVLNDWAWEQSQPPDLAASVRRHGLGTVFGKLQCHATPHSGYFDPENTPSLMSAPKSSRYSRDVVFELALAAGRRITLGGFAEDAP